MKGNMLERMNGIGVMLRFVTPIAVVIFGGLSTFALGQVNERLASIGSQLADIGQKLYHHQTNADIHVPKSEYVQLQNQIENMRKEVIASIRDAKR